MRILVVEDHAVVRAGLRHMLTATLGAELRETADGGAAWSVMGAWRPDLVILDLNLPGQGGFALLPDLRKAGMRVLVLSMHGESIYATRALAAGALGYVSKNASPEDLLTAIRAVAAGRRHIEPRMAHDIALQRVDAGERLHQLTPRDMEIMRLMAAGSSLTTIAASIGVSYKTVANTVSLIRTKLGVHRTADIIRLAIELGGVGEKM